jgi:hypothetical protein
MAASIPGSPHSNPNAKTSAPVATASFVFITTLPVLQV